MDKEWKSLLISLVSVIIISLLLITVGIYSAKLVRNKVIDSKENYENNIIIEIETGLVIDSTKENLAGILFGDIKYETAINVNGEIIISNDKDIYYKSVNKIGKDVEISIKNNKNIDCKNILDVK